MLESSLHYGIAKHCTLFYNVKILLQLLFQKCQKPTTFQNYIKFNNFNETMKLCLYNPANRQTQKDK